MELQNLVGLETGLRALKFGALHCLLILCMGTLPVAGVAASDSLHHPEGNCVNCHTGPLTKPGDCGGEICTLTASSCNSHHGSSMIGVAITNLPPAIPGGVGAVRGKDHFVSPPPSRIERPPIT